MSIHSVDHIGYPFTVCGIPSARRNYLFGLVFAENVSCPICRAALQSRRITAPAPSARHAGTAGELAGNPAFENGRRQPADRIVIRSFSANTALGEGQHD